MPTTSLTSAWSITAAANVPRASFVDYPLGHTSGKAFDLAGQDLIVRAALRQLAEARTPGIVDLGLSWGHDRWRRDPMGGSPDRADWPAESDEAGGQSLGDSGSDSRVKRFDTPQYQSEADAVLASARVGAEVACRACVGFDS